MRRAGIRDRGREREEEGGSRQQPRGVSTRSCRGRICLDSQLPSWTTHAAGCRGHVTFVVFVAHSAQAVASMRKSRRRRGKSNTKTTQSTINLEITGRKTDHLSTLVDCLCVVMGEQFFCKKSSFYSHEQTHCTQCSTTKQSHKRKYFLYSNKRHAPL